jgi:alpha-beta hydrolase superfamily lysophospholipase
MPFDRQTSLASPTGAKLNLYVRNAEASPRGVVQINHGLAEHAVRYARFADHLAAHGFVAYAHDHRGHGHTTAPDAPPRVFATEDGCGKVVADVNAVHDLIRQENPGLPVIAFGHSMGGLVALNFVLRHSERVQGAAVWNANFSAGLSGRLAQGLLAWERFRLGSDMPSQLLPKLTFQAWAKKIPNARTDFDWLSRDAAEVEKYIADPLCGWNASVSMWRDVFQLIFAGANDDNFFPVRKGLPVHLLGGGQDPSTDGGKAVKELARRMERMGFLNLETRIYPENRHEALNELNRNEVMAEFTRWAERIGS